MQIKVLIAHPGTQYAFQVAKQLERIGLLYQFWTSIALPENQFQHKLIKSLLSNRIVSKFSNRIISDINPSKIKTILLPELRLLLERSNLDSEQLIYKRNKRFQEAIPDSAIKEADIIIGFDTSSWILAERAHKHGKKFILDQSIAHPKLKETIYARLNVLYPNWMQQLKPKTNALLEIESLEHKLADAIITASSFTRNSLISQGVDKEKIKLNPYGVNLNQFKFIEKGTTKEKVIFLFLGTLCVRKGLPALLDVWQQLNPDHGELWLIGPYDEDVKKNIPNSETIKLIGKIPHSKLSDFIKQCDVLVFPSFYEGFGLVILEAMACGMPVITTEATAGPDIITNNEDGFLYNSFDLKPLKDHITYLLDNPKEIRKIGMRAHKTALKYSWEAYGERWVDFVNNIDTKKC